MQYVLRSNRLPEPHKDFVVVMGLIKNECGIGVVAALRAKG